MKIVIEILTYISLLIIMLSSFSSIKSFFRRIKSSNIIKKSTTSSLSNSEKEYLLNTDVSDIKYSDELVNILKSYRDEIKSP